MSDGSKISDFRKYTEIRLTELEVWWRARTNHDGQEAWGCGQAVTVRDRLGSGEYNGVPLWVELKSKIGIFIEKSSGKEHFFAAHSRGNCRFNDKDIAQVLGIDMQAVKLVSFLDGEGSSQGDLSESEIYGLVNPLNVELLFASQGYEVSFEDITQIFDVCLMTQEGYPQTVTTNFGQRTVAIEVRPDDLIAAIASSATKSVTAPISQPNPVWLGIEGEPKRDYWSKFPPPNGPKIGILTGNSPESGLTLWQDFLTVYRNCFNNTADVLMPETMIISIPQMGLTMELIEREEYVWVHIKKSIENMLESGCKLITVACNTTIYFEPQICRLCEPYGARFVSIAEASIAAVKSKLSKSTQEKVGIVGIGPVINMDDEFSGYKIHFDRNSIVPMPFDGTDIAYEIKNAGTDNRKINSAVTKLRNLINRQIGDTDIVVVLALTEVSLAFRRHKETASKKGPTYDNYIDPLEELARYLVYEYVHEGYKNSQICQIPDDFPVAEKLNRILNARLTGNH